MKHHAIRSLSMLLIVLMLIAVLPAALATETEEQTASVTSVVQNFDGLTELSSLGWTFPEGQPELVTSGDGKALKFQSQLAPNRGMIEIPFAGTEKTLKFDFMTETELSSFFGFYVQLHRENGCKNGLGAAVMPGYGENQTLSTNVYINGAGTGDSPTEQKFGYSAVAANKWYTYEIKLTDEVLQIRVYPQNAASVPDWQISHKMPSGYTLSESQNTDVAICLVSSALVTGYVDNVSVVGLKENIQLDFNDVTDLTKLDAVTFGGNVSLEGTAASGALKLTASNNNKAIVNIPTGAVQKRVQFDVKHDGSFTEFWGLYLRMYLNTGDVGTEGVGGSLLPAYSAKQNVDIYLPDNNYLRSSNSAEFTADTWYTCVWEMTDFVVRMKLFPKGSAEPADWTASKEFPEGYVLSPEQDCNLQFTLVSNTATPHTMWIDNLSIENLTGSTATPLFSLSAKNLSTLADLPTGSTISGDVTLEKGSASKVLRLDAASGSKAVVEIEYPRAQKTLRFDMKQDGSFGSFYGLYVLLYQEWMCNDGAGGAIMPAYTNNQVMVNIYSRNESSATYSGEHAAKAMNLSPNVWYTCVLEMTDSKTRIKVYPTGETEPQTWSAVYDTPNNYTMLQNMNVKLVNVSDRNSTIWLDNISVSPVSTTPQTSMTDPEHTYLSDNFESYDTGAADKSTMPVQYLNIPSAQIQEVNGGKVLALQADTASENLVIFVPTMDKDLLFDFSYEEAFRTYGGLYTTLHREPDGRPYNFSFNPTLSTRFIVSDDGTNLLHQTGPAFAEDTWYRCRARLQNKTYYVKIWLVGEDEPAAWQYVYSFEDHGITANEQDQILFRAFEPDDKKNTIYLDNLVVKTWEELSITACSVTVETADLTMGTVTGGGTYPVGAAVTVKAAPVAGYCFVSWTDAEGNVVSTDANYSFTAASGIRLTANFEKLIPTIKSFMAAGMTLPAEIDTANKTVTVTFASDTDLSQVRPYFYLENGDGTEPKPYAVMDLSDGSAAIGEWTVYVKKGEKNTVMQQFYVNPVTGDDANDGTTCGKAVKTLARAQELVRDIDSWTGDVIVNLAGGEYLLTETLQFTSADSAENGCAVIWQGADNTVLTSGRHLSGWTQSRDVEGAWEISAEGIPYSRDLFVESVRATLARSSAEESIIPVNWDTADQPDMEFIPSYGYTTSGNRADMYKWKNQSDIEFVYEVGWTYSVIPVDNITQEGDGSKVTMMARPFSDAQIKGGVNIQDPNYIQNAIELLDEPGEWYFDNSAKKIYYIPGEGIDPNDLEIIMPTLDQLLQVRGAGTDPVEGLALRNITFTYTSFLRPHTMGQVEVQANFVVNPDLEAWNARDCALKTPGGVTAAYAHGMRVEGCTFTKMSAGGFDFEEGCAGCTLTDNTFNEIAATGIQIGEVSARDAQPFADATYINGVFVPDAGPDPARVTEQILVMSNLINRAGTEYKGSIGIFAGCVRDVTIAHNKLSNLPYTGISAGWNWGTWDQGGRPDHPFYKFDTPTIQERYVIENNEIISVMQRLHDGASIYTLSLMPGSIIRGNYMHDTAYEISGIYNDEASGGFVHISENVVANSHGNYYFYHNVGGLYPDRQAATRAVMHDNFWNYGAEEPLYQEIVGRAGLLPRKDSYGPSADQAAAAVEDRISAIGTVTLNSEDAIAAARAAYDALTDAQKALVENLSVLEAAEKKYAELVEQAKQEEIDEAAASGVEALIDAIGTVTLGDKADIEAARAAYEALTDAQKAKVDNYAKLVAAEAELKDLIEDAFITGPLIISGAANPFKDIKNHWAKDAIGYVYGQGLMNGVSDNKFDPDGTLTRAMVVTILYRLSGEPATFGAMPFSDVTGGSWYAKAVQWASKNNIVNGMGDGTFAPMQNITREQFASILYRYAQYRGERTGAKANLNGYTDAGQIGGWATEAMAWAAAEGLINGRTATTIAPKGTATRAEAATILMRFCKLF